MCKLVSSDDNTRIQTNTRFSNNLIQIRNFEYAKVHTNLLFELRIRIQIITNSNNFEFE
jgi:hypothetical protein